MNNTWHDLTPTVGTWDGSGPCNFLNRVERGPQPGRLVCGAVTTPAHRGPLECGLPAGHPGGVHVAPSINFVWAVRDWENTPS